MTEIIKNYYNGYDEKTRLEKDNAHKIEFITSLKYILDYTSKNDTILDACAGTGAYSFALAENKRIVTAGDLVQSHVDEIRFADRSQNLLKEIKTTNVLDLSEFKNNSFDAVLCMGALYHLNNKDDRIKAISECLRVLKPGGTFVAAYINRHALILNRMLKEDSFLTAVNDIYQNGYSDKVKDGMVFYTSSRSEFAKDIEGFDLQKLKLIGSDGIGYAIADKINKMDEAQFKTWLEYHLNTCENSSIIDYSLHALYIGKKGK